MKTGIQYREGYNSGTLQAAEFYIGLFHGRNSVDENLNGWGFDGPILGPILSVEQTTSKDLVITFKNGESYTPNIVDGLFEFEGKFYGDWTFFWYDHKELPIVNHDKLPIAQYPFTENTFTPKIKGMYLIKHGENKSVISSDALIGPLLYLHTTYSSHFRVGANNLSKDAIDLYLSTSTEVKPLFKLIKF